MRWAAWQPICCWATRPYDRSPRKLDCLSGLRILDIGCGGGILSEPLARLGGSVVGIDPAAAQRMLDLLNNYLRATLGGSRVAWHPLQDEFARLHDYLELMRVRMGARLQFTLTLPEDLQAIPVPPLLLQPLVENAIVHGLEPTVQGGSVQVRAQRRTDAAGEDWLVLEVRDSGARLHAGTPGRTSSRFGLTQVRERLTSCYGPQATLELIAEPDQFTLASLQIPFKNA